MVDKLAVVKINPAAQIKRLRKKTGLSREEILARVKAQIPQAVKYRMADFIIDNSGIKEKTRKQVMAIRRKLWRN
jgi:dephospho-CoA kinase